MFGGMEISPNPGRRNLATWRTAQSRSERVRAATLVESPSERKHKPRFPRKFPNYGVARFAAAFLILAVYVVTLAMRDRKLKSEIDRVRRMVEK